MTLHQMPRSGMYIGILAAAMAAMARAAMAAHLPEPETAEFPGRPRVCLVLSGGGARGAAHIGVLKVLEELHVPIDCIAGTSMGALVGAGYASGSTVAELESLARNVTTDLLFKERPPRRDTANRRKQDDRTNLFSPEIGVRGTELLLPKGAVSGVQLETVLRQVSRVRGYRKFDELGIPFRAVATDLVSGKAVVFSAGELPNVMRASMSVPGAIAPAQIEDQLLVDGGLTNNLPVDVARQMGADVIIAVNLGTTLSPREELNSIVGVTGQVINILTEQNVRASLAQLTASDILIQPELGNFSAGDFDNMAAAIDTGEQAARTVAPQLARLSLPPPLWDALRDSQLEGSEPDSRSLVAVRIDNARRVNPEVTAALMDTRAGQPVDQVVLDRDIRRIFGTGDFEHVSYRIDDGPGGPALVIDTVEKSWGPNYLRVGLGLSSDFTGDSFFNTLVSYRQTWVNSLGAEWRSDLQFGRTSFVSTEFYQPLQKDQYLFVAPAVLVRESTRSVFSGNDRLGDLDVTTVLGALDLGSQLKKYGEVRLGLQYGTVSTDPDTILLPRGLIEDSVRVAGFRFRLLLDQLDSVNFPRDGYSAAFSVFGSRTGLGADSNYNRWDADLVAVQSFGENTFQLAFRGGGALGSDDLPAFDAVQWGGFLQQSGFRTGALLGQRLLFGRALYYRRLARFPLFDGSYAGLSLELGKVSEPIVPGSPISSQSSGSVFLATDTPLGPVYLGYGLAEGGESSLYFYLGRIGFQ